MSEIHGFQGCPILGVGLGLRHPLLEETLEATDLIHWLEITPENYLNKGGQASQSLRRARERYPLVSHGVSLSLGSLDAWDEAYLKALGILFREIDPPWFSDHLCFSGISGVYFNDLLPLPRTQEAIQHAVERIRFIKARFERPFLIENISYYLQYPDQELPEADFLSEILEQSDCGLLLDVNNVYVNARNHGGDPLDFLARIPLNRVVQIHVAGHTHYDEDIVDTHGSPVCEEVWQLLEWVLDRTRPCGVMLERDLNIPAFSELEPELRRIRKLWNQTQLDLASFKQEAAYATF